MAKAALYVIRDDIQAAAGLHQLCAGQIAGTDAAVHAVSSVFNHNDSDAILLVDATNAFNSLNRSVAMHNIQQLCPPLSCILINTYCSPASLFVTGDTILSEEGTTQGDPRPCQCTSDVRYVSIYRSIAIFRKYRDTIQHVSVSIFLLIQFCSI